jgi:predicted transcriptional regulator
VTRSAPKASRNVRTSVLLPEDSYTQIQTMADANRVSSAWIIRHALLKFLAEQNDQLLLPLAVADR